MREITATEKMLRFNMFPKAIEELYYTNIIVHRVLKNYLAGRIMSRDEALEAMIVNLAKDSDQIREAFLDFAQKVPITIQIPKNQYDSPLPTS